ncbi:MAG: hypothetical protein U1E65_12935 [Myxococcota bacterium]
MADRIEKRRTFAGTGMLADPEYIEALDKRRDLHDRLTHGKPARPFSEVLDEKMYGKKAAEEPEAPPEKGAIEPHLGLAPTQDAGLVTSGKGRRSGRVIVKG